MLEITRRINMKLSVLPFMIILGMSYPSAGAGLSEQAHSSSSPTYRYTPISDAGRTGFLLDPANGELRVLTNGHMLGPRYKITYCDEESSLICFDAPYHSKYVAIHKKLYSHRKWTFKKREYEVVRTEEVPGCGINYIIHSTANGALKEAYIFNDHLGLTVIAETSAYAQAQVGEHTGSKVRSPVFFVTFIADGAGFGFSKPCNALVLK
jgi:hypothetical protein